YQLSIINYQLSIINYQLSIINYQLSIINYQLLVLSVAEASIPQPSIIFIFVIIVNTQIIIIPKS
ncbi:MAG: hypothetical protein COB15_11260, partial [Flavobacteriales bacterium]